MYGLVKLARFMQASNASSRLYAVLSVLPTDDCLLTDAVRFSDSFAAMATAGNYDPTPANASSRLKEVTVTVEMGIGGGCGLIIPQHLTHQPQMASMPLPW